MKMSFFLSSRDARTLSTNHPGAFRILGATLHIVNRYYAARVANFAAA
jgi:hypothetical protein